MNIYHSAKQTCHMAILSNDILCNLRNLQNFIKAFYKICLKGIFQQFLALKYCLECVGTISALLRKMVISRYAHKFYSISVNPL